MTESKSLIKQISIPEKSRLLTPEFIYGVATASFQIEGGRESRGQNIWDTFCQSTGTIEDGSNGDVACNHYQLWEDDVELIRSLNVDAYRFSISWTRVLNKDGTINHKGIEFYSRLLDRLNEYGIKPFVTLYHWDLPQHLEHKGGWLNRDTAYRFRDYADKVSRLFKDKVYSYATLNEPYCSAHLGYETGIHAPGIKHLGKKAAHHLLLAHGLGMQVLQSNSPESKNGIVVNLSPTYPATASSEDIKAAKIADQDINHWYIKPILDGQYPELLELTPEKDRPDIQQDDLKIISTAVDYLGINYYTRTVIEASQDNLYEVTEPTIKPLTEMDWEVFPQGYFDILTRLNNEYKLPPVYLTENGAAMPDQLIAGEVQDLDRVDFFQTHFEAVHQAIEAGVDIQSYFAWSLMDNFEWARGYTKRFGLVYVNYETQQRIIKQSGLAFRDFIGSR
ncbi:MAG: beta-glucosidase [Enterobacterales bacterium]|jgi:beta-glucosidase